MLMKVIVMFCFVQYMICQEMTEMMTSESSNMTMDDSNESADITDQSSNSTDAAGDNDNSDGDDGSDDDVVYVKSLRKMLEVILNSLGDLLSNSTIVKTKANKTMTNNIFF
uniref:Hypotheticial protein n=1 Tax=Schistosoma japonicum TaxID=6182 RepID=C1LY69_SCHJA|nr:hypotheticial protein [Schistosoma japonicum]